MRVAVTGCASDFGTVLLPRLLADPEVEEVVGIGRRNPPRVVHDKLTFVREDVRSPRMRELFEGCEVVYHLAFVAAEIRDKQLTHDVNFNGSVNVIRAAHEAGVRRLIVSSSISAYGVHADNPAFCDEDDFPRGNPDKYYFYDSAEVEHFAEWWMRRHDGLAIVLLRAAFACGPTFDNEGLEMFCAPTMMIPSGEGRFQLIHEDDIADAFHRALRADLVGPYNLAPDDTLSLHELGEIHGQRVVTLPAAVARRGADVLFALGLAPFSSHWVIAGEAPVRSERFRAATGWEPRYDCRETAHIMFLQSGRPLVHTRGELHRHEVAEGVLEPVTAELRRRVADDEELDEALDHVEHVFVELGGDELHLELHPAGRDARATVLLSPALGGHARAYTPLLAALRRAGFDAIGIDRPGHGLSQGRRGDCPPPLAAATLERAVAYAHSRSSAPIVLCGAAAPAGVDAYLSAHPGTLTLAPGIAAGIGSPSPRLAAIVRRLAAVAPLARVGAARIAARPSELEAALSAGDRLWCATVTARTAAGALAEAAAFGRLRVDGLQRGTDGLDGVLGRWLESGAREVRPIVAT